MHKRANQLQVHHTRSKRIIILFFIDVLLLFLSLLAALIQTKYSRAVIVIGLSLDIYFMILTVVYSMKNLVLAGHLEEYFFNKNYGTSSSKVHQFHKLMDDNLFRYYFQPIINAKTGEIFAYEALMRTDTDYINMLPLEIMDLASKEGRLYEIEKHTFFNVLKLMKDYADIFKSKKLFINSIPSHQLTDDDFQNLCSEYGTLLPNVIIEITEATNISDATLALIHKRLKSTGFQLGLDDYGTGYASADSLIKVKPKYIKIDRSILKYINTDSKKQSLVSELLNAAKSNNIKTIAVGIETFEELEFIIGLEVDYVQGFYTARPDKMVADNIPDDVIQEIQRIYYQKYCESSAKMEYETNGETVLYLSDISPDKFYNVVIREETLTIKGDPDIISDIAIIIPDNHKCNLTLDNVSLRNNERPCILLSSNSSATINLVGNNQLISDGIRVNETADLTITGDGNLSVHADRTGRVGIGGSDSQSYGNITLAHTGSIKVKSNGNISIGIGGGQNPANSYIHLLSGNVKIEAIGYNSICIGSVLGASNIEIGSDCKLVAKAEATKAVCLGSLVGTVHIVSSGQLDVRCDSRISAVIGVIDEGEGSITIKDGFSNIRLNSQTGIGIGAVNGNLAISFEGGDFMVYGEGRELLGLGDHAGNSRIKINGGVLAIQLFMSTSIMTGTVAQKIIIDSGNIQCDFPEETVLVNSYGTPLVSHIITNSDEFQHTIETVSYSYEYKASYSSRHPFIKVYLPENWAVS